MSPTVFYDGECALCHRFVLFVLKHDKQAIFRFAPLQGEAAGREVDLLADSVVVKTADGDLLVYSSAVVYVLRELGFSGAARVLELIPLRDFAYRLVAKVRKQIFGRRTKWCPIVPDELRGRFIN